MKADKKTMGRKGLALWLLLAAALLCAFLIFEDNSLTLSRSTVLCEELPEEFDGFTIVQISDLHNKRFGREQQRLIETVRTQEPDIIVITGDIIDRRRFDIAPAEEFVRGAAAIAPVYYVMGNHEALSGRYMEVRAALEAAGATVLEDSLETISREGRTISLIGIADNGSMGEATMKAKLDGFAGVEGCKLLLSHRPEYFLQYCAAGMDVVFSGHAHGGQVRLPFIGGLYAPGQGLFPSYTAGVYREGGTAMCVSRGLGNSLFPFRVFNRPEVVCVTLTSDMAQP